MAPSPGVACVSARYLDTAASTQPSVNKKVRRKAVAAGFDCASLLLDNLMMNQYGVRSSAVGLFRSSHLSFWLRTISQGR
jgi:hypothetical protein